MDGSTLGGLTYYCQVDQRVPRRGDLEVYPAAVHSHVLLLDTLQDEEGVRRFRRIVSSTSQDPLLRPMRAVL